MPLRSFVMGSNLHLFTRDVRCRVAFRALSQLLLVSMELEQSVCLCETTTVTRAPCDAINADVNNGERLFVLRLNQMHFVCRRRTVHVVLFPPAPRPQPRPTIAGIGNSKKYRGKTGTDVVCPLQDKVHEEVATFPLARSTALRAHSHNSAH